MKVIIIIIIVIAVLAGVYFFWIAPNQANDFTQKSVLPSGLTANAEVTYQSKGFGFSFKYPTGWEVKEAEQGIVLIKSGKNIPDDDAPISIDASGIEPYRTSTQSVRDALVGESETRVQVGKFEGIQFIGKISDSIGSGAGQAVIYTMLNRDGNLFSIDYSHFASEPANTKDVYKAIVASFSFDN